MTTLLFPTVHDLSAIRCLFPFLLPSGLLWPPSSSNLTMLIVGLFFISNWKCPIRTFRSFFLFCPTHASSFSLHFPFLCRLFKVIQFSFSMLHFLWIFINVWEWGNECFDALFWGFNRLLFAVVIAPWLKVLFCLQLLWLHTGSLDTFVIWLNLRWR